MTLKLNKETLRALETDEQKQVAAGMMPASYYYSCQDVCYTDKCKTAAFSNCAGVCKY